VRHERESQERLEYVHLNPLRRGLVKRPEEVARTGRLGPRFFVVNWGLNAYAGVDAAEPQSRCGVTIDRVRLPADEKARI
jgi:hypothetical protein